MEWMKVYHSHYTQKQFLLYNNVKWVLETQETERSFSFQVKAEVNDLAVVSWPYKTMKKSTINIKLVEKSLQL